MCWLLLFVLRRAWQAEKEALRQRRLQQEAAAKEREAAAKAAAAAARAEEHRKRMEERKAKYVSARHNASGINCQPMQKSVLACTTMHAVASVQAVLRLPALRLGEPRLTSRLWQHMQDSLHDALYCHALCVCRKRSRPRRLS